MIGDGLIEMYKYLVKNVSGTHVKVWRDVENLIKKQQHNNDKIFIFIGFTCLNIKTIT